MATKPLLCTISSHEKLHVYPENIRTGHLTGKVEQASRLSGTDAVQGQRISCASPI